MKKNIIFIGGAIALLGAGAFLYFKNKKKSVVASSSLSTLPLSEIAKTEESAEAIKIKQDIKDLATSIKEKRDRISILQNQLKSFGNVGRRAIIGRKIADIQNPLNSELAKLKELGYTELNGSAVKIG
jgi:septal ring factor EnvC (AmiA/AmiB activator)